MPSTILNVFTGRGRLNTNMSPLAKLSMSAVQILPRVRLVIEMVLVALLGLLVARILWITVDRSGAVSRPLPQFAMTQTGAGDAQSLHGDITLLTRINRFGQPDGTAGTGIVPNAPPTTLNLKLKGLRSITSGSDESAPGVTAIAIIQMSDKQARSFVPGDTIIDGVTLDRVLPDRVLLRKGGALETLMMESNSDTLAVLSLPGQDGMVEGGLRPSVVSQSPATIDAALLASLDVSPVLRDGILTGYRITTPGATSALSGTGLESGDIITQLDGRPVTEIEIQSFTQRLSNAAELSLTVQRNGASVPVTLRFPEGD